MFCMVLTTAQGATTQKIIEALLSRELAACIQTMPVRSHYVWQGVLRDEAEDLLIIKAKVADWVDVEAAIRRALADLDDPLQVGGVETTARVLGRMTRERNTTVLGNIREKEGELADKLQRLMVVFDDLVHLEDRAVQAVLRVVDRADLVLALKGASSELRERFLKNLSSRAAQDLMEELEIATSVRKAQMREAQEKIVMAAQKLADEGVIMLGPETEDEG